jgi:hypothetical protein
VPNGITGLAYDSETDRLLASSGRFFGGGTPGAIFLLDPRNGSLTPLNLDAPNLYGIAEAQIPEPGTAWMLLVGLAACIVIQVQSRLNETMGRDVRRHGQKAPMDGAQPGSEARARPSEPRSDDYGCTELPSSFPRVGETDTLLVPRPIEYRPAISPRYSVAESN